MINLKLLTTKIANKSFPSLISLFMRIRLFEHSFHHTFMFLCSIVDLKSLQTFKIPRTTNTIMLAWPWLLFIDLELFEFLGIVQILVNLVVVFHVVFRLVESTMVRLVLPGSRMTLLHSAHFLLLLSGKLKNYNLLVWPRAHLGNYLKTIFQYTQYTITNEQTIEKIEAQIFVTPLSPFPALFSQYMTPTTTIGTIHHLSQDSSPTSPIKNASLLAYACSGCFASRNCWVASLPFRLFKISAPPGCSEM